MTRIAAVLAAALVASGCIITSDDEPDVDSVILYWDFLRYAPDNANAVDGFILYDATTYTGTPGAACPESGVEELQIDGPNGPLVLDCITQGQGGGVQGVILDYLPVGPVNVRVRAWRGGALLWDGTRTLEVDGAPGEQVYYFDVDPLVAPFELVGFFRYAPNQYYGSCDQAGNPTVTYAVYDVLDNLIIDGTAACPGTSSAFPLLVVPALDLDLDTYLVRLQGFEGGAVPTYDSCGLELDHYGTHTGASAWDVDLVESAVCP